MSLYKSSIRNFLAYITAGYLIVGILLFAFKKPKTTFIVSYILIYILIIIIKFIKKSVVEIEVNVFENCIRLVIKSFFSNKVAYKHPLLNVNTAFFMTYGARGSRIEIFKLEVDSKSYQIEVNDGFSKNKLLQLQNELNDLKKQTDGNNIHNI